RWLQLLLYTNPAGGDVASPLLQLAASRGRLMELLAGKLHPGRKEAEDHAFMAGIMSLMPTLMGVPFEQILRSISVGQDIAEALTAHRGELGILLALAEALEVGDGPACHQLAEQLPGIDHRIVNGCLTQALAWASNIGKENP
ncbi:MAG TPA: diguanylate phosphodiesterase, partial [Rhodocyclaceae bacterium]|nr:diguanylate phosphodiesterase [Rhodocyclaceae bacterium]